MTRELLLITHILLLVAWLGIDVGVFYSSFVMRRPGLSTETRMQVRRIMVTLDLAPRVSLILMIPVSLGLAYATGLGFASLDDSIIIPLLWVLTGLAVAWSWWTVKAFTKRQTEPTADSVVIFGKVDTYARVAFAAIFIALGVLSLLGAGPFGPVWLALKSLLFGMVIGAGLWIRVAAQKYRPALNELLERGESVERLAAVNQAIRGVYPAVLSVWGGLIVIVFLAVFRP